MAWTLVVVLVVLRFSGGFAGFRAVLRNRRSLLLLSAGAVFVTSNWGTYIYGVNSGHVVESSLGYFINPLFTILLGVLVLHERLRPAQWVAVAIGAAAVVVIAVDYGRPPWIALVLAFSFGMYGFCKKQADVGAADSLAVETTVLFVPAIVALSIVGAHGDLVFGTRWSTSLLIATSGVVTAVPLLLFAAGAARVPLTTTGLLQYVTPVMQLVLGVAVFHEAMPASRWAGFALVWVALVLLTTDMLRAARSARGAGLRNASVTKPGEAGQFTSAPPS